MPYINRIRLPLTVSKPQFLDEQEKYRRADGTMKTLSVVVRKQYEAKTDYLPEKLHERLKIAIAHSKVNVEGERYLGGVAQEGSYEINWPDFLDFPLGQATVKLEATPFNASLDNCGTCEEYQQVMTEDDDIGTVGEDETVNVPVLYNDAICCSPFEISLVSFNSTYLDSVNIVGNMLQLHTKTGIPTQFNVVLATYRVTCQDGQYDEANVIADVQGSVDECLSVSNLLVDAITSNTADVSWTGNEVGGCGFRWRLYLTSNLGTPVQTGTTMDEDISLTGLTPGRSYTIFVEQDCCDEDISPAVSQQFDSGLTPAEGECGNYAFEYNDPEFNETALAQFQYLDCDDNYQSVNVPNFQVRTRCIKQTSPGNPVYVHVLQPNTTVTYQFECE